MSRKHFKRLVSRRYEKKTELNCYVYNFNVDYDAIAVDDILDIPNYLMKNNNMI